jgi:transposase
MRLDYDEVIKEDVATLLRLERQARGQKHEVRLKLLRLLKSGQCRSVQGAVDTLGYSLRQGQRWLNQYREAGLKGLEVEPPDYSGRERMTPEAWTALNEGLAKDQISNYAQARALLAEQGVVYQDDTGVLKLFRRHGIKAKTGRPRHLKADAEAQATFKKTSPSD